MRVTEFLDKSGVKYEVAKHPVAFSAQTMAAVMHESGKFVAKPVLVKADDKYLLCVLAASSKIDLPGSEKTARRKIGGTGQRRRHRQSCFPDCELGAEPPFGNLYDVPTIMDKSLEKDDHIVFQAAVTKRQSG